MGPKRKIKESTIKQAAKSLDKFLGNKRIKLFLAQLCGQDGRHIVICEKYEDSGMGRVYFLDGKGLHLSVESMGTWTRYFRNVPPPTVRKCTSLEAVQYYAEKVGDPRKIVGHIREQLALRFNRALRDV